MKTLYTHPRLIMLVLACAVTALVNAAASVELDGGISSGAVTNTTGNSVTINHTTGTGTNRLMLVGVSWNANTTAQTISSVTFTPNGGSAVGLTEVRTQQAGTMYRYAAIYRLVNPSSGQTGTVTVTFSGSVANGIIVGAANFKGVGQTTPLGSSNGAGATNGTAVSVSLTGLNGNELAFDTVFLGGNPPPTLTADSSQTQRWNTNISNARGAASTKPATTNSVTMSWTAASSGPWAIVAVPIKLAVDTTPPTVTINQAAGQADPTSASPINFTVVFSEPVTDFATGDVTLSGTAGATTAIVTGSGTNYNVAVSGMTGSGTVIASIAAGVAHDAANNPNVASTSTDNTVTLDTTAPTVTINQAAGQADPTSASPINFTVVFSEPVTDFATGDVTLSGTAGATTAIVTGSGTNYNVAVSGMTGSGTVIASIAAGVAHDAANNPNVASTSTDNAVTYQEPPITYVGDVGSVASNAAGTTLQIPVGAGGVATGDTIIVGFASRGSPSYTTPVVSDSAGNTYLLATNAITYGHGRAYLFYAHVDTALANGNKITITTYSLTNRVAVASVFRGLMASNVLDQALNNPTGSTTTTNGNNPTVGPTGPTVQTNELIIGVIGTEEETDAGVGTWQNGFTAGPQIKSSGSTTYEWRVSQGYKIVSATGTFTAAKIVTNSPYWAATIATFKASALAPRPTAVVSGSATICNGGTTTIQAALTGTGPWNLTWSDGTNQNGVASSPVTRNVSPSATTIYTVTALSDANGSAEPGDLTGSAVVTVNPRPTSAVSGTTTICNGGTTTIQTALTGTGPWNLTWSDGTNQNDVAASPATRNVDPSATTIYTVTALSDANCAAQGGDLTGSAVVTVNARPTSAVSGSTTICNGGATTIEAALTGTGPWNVTWSDGPTQNGVASSPATRSVGPSATTIYTVTTLSDANCTAEAGDRTGSAVVTVNPRPTAAVSGDATICNGGTTTIQAALSGTGPWNVTWSDGATQNGVAASPATRSVGPSATTNYTVTALSDANCAAQGGDLTGSAVVTVNARPTSTVSGSATICNGGTTTIQAALSGTGPWNLTWSDGTNQNGVATSPATRNVDPSATTNYTVTALSDANCAAQAGDLTGSAVVTVNPRPTSAVSGSATICDGGTTTIQAALTGTGPWNLTWSDGTNQNGVATSPATRSVGPSATTIYTVTALSDANCSAEAGDLTGSAVVTVNPRPTAAVSGSATICDGGTTTIQAALTGTGPWNVTWSDGPTQNGVATSAATRSVSPSATTTYTVTALSDANCVAQAGDLSGSAVVTVQSAFEAWQLQYFGCTNCPEAAATADPDGDGQNNQAEFLAGFNPTNNAAYLHIISIVRSNNDLVATYLGANGDTSCPCGATTRTNVLDFAAGAGTQGSYTNNFASTGLTNILTGGTGLGTNVMVTDVGGATNKPSRFYRIRVLVP